MRRREFIALVGGASLACRSRARAQQPPHRTLRLGLLEPGAPPDPLLEAMRGRLRELGYGEGRDLVLEVRWAEGNLARLPELKRRGAFRDPPESGFFCALAQNGKDEGDG
jgi:putative ABC transport system substrate-binding protein